MKNKINTVYIWFAFILTCIFTATIWIMLETDIKPELEYPTFALISALLLANFGILIFSAVNIKRKRETIKKAFDSYVEESVASVGVGLIIFNESSDIIWASKFIEDRMHQKIVGKKLYALSKDFDSNFKEGKTIFNFDIAGIIFQAQINFDSKTVILKDITNENMVMKQYISEKVVVAEVEIDNFQQLQTILAEEDLFKVQSAVIKMLDELVDKYNLFYRQYVNGKYLIYTNQSVLEILEKNRFDFFDSIRSIEVLDGLNLSASMGIGKGSSQIKTLIDLAKDGLMQALARGGDQVAIMELNKKPHYFGSKTEAVATSSRVKIKQIANLLEMKLKSKQIKKVIIHGHIFADLDAVGASMGMAYLAKQFKKDVYIQNATFDTTTENTINKFLTKEEREIFIKKSKANKLSNKSDTLLIIVDTAELSRIENDKALDNVSMENVFIFDHHRVSRLPEEISATNTYIDTSSSSASEITTEVLQFISKSIKPPKQTAQMLLNGICLDTNQFTKSTSSRTFAAASYLEKYGASVSISTDILKLPEEYSSLISAILSSVREVRPGYFLSSYPGEVPQDIISFAADEILRVQGRRAAFVIAKLPNKNEFKMSARGNETNVQVIAEAVGGGGHFGASAANSSEPLSVFEDNIIQSIISSKGEKK